MGNCLWWLLWQHRCTSRLLHARIRVKFICAWLSCIFSRSNFCFWKLSEIIVPTFDENRSFSGFGSPLGSLGTSNARFSYWTHWKTLSGLPIHVNWTIFRQVLRLRRYKRISIGNRRFLKSMSQIRPKFRVEWDVQHQPFSHTVR